MNNAKHTPGPWKASREEDGERYITANHENAPVGFSRTVAVLQREWFKNGSDGLHETAALIAAAPELLAALVSLQAEAWPLRSKNVRIDFSFLLADSAARAAIRKAKGE